MFPFLIPFLVQIPPIEWGAVTGMCAVVGLVCAGGAVYVRYVVRDEIQRLDDRYVLRRECDARISEHAEG